MTAIIELKKWIEEGIATLEKGGHNKLTDDCDGCARLRLYYEFSDKHKELCKNDRTFLEKSFTKNDDLIDDLNFAGDFLGKYKKDLEEVGL